MSYPRLFKLQQDRRKLAVTLREIGPQPLDLIGGLAQRRHRPRLMPYPFMISCFAQPFNDVGHA
jgi:hypothetical protein